jgi:hypothetical protein
LALSPADVSFLVEHATQAPSGGNVQPWNWVYQDKTLLLFNDVNRSASVLNYNSTGSLLTFGASIENLVLASTKNKWFADITYFPLGTDNQLMASIVFSPLEETTTQHPYPNLIDSVFQRGTNRTLGKRTEIADQKYSELSNIVSTVEGAQLKIFSSDSELDSFKSVLGEIDKLFMTNQTGHAHFTKEIRWSQKEAEETRDGVDINTIDLTPTERAGLILARNWNVTKHIKKWKLGNEFGKLSQKAVDAASCLGMITMPSRSPINYINGGRAVERLWLAATAKGIALQPMSISTFLFARIDDDNFEGIEEIRDGIVGEYNKVRQLADLQENEKDVFFFRLSLAPKPDVLALRRKLEDVLVVK